MAVPTKEVLEGAIREADLQSLSSKKVRKQLEYKFGAELSERKREIDDFLMTCVAELEKEKEKEGNDVDSDDDKLSTNGDAPPAKKPKLSNDASTSKASKTEDNSSDTDLSDRDNPNDEEIARRLQKEELGTRACRKASRKTNDKKDKKPRAKRESKGTSIYSQECFLSPELGDLMGQEKMARKDVVKNVWRIIKERDLQDPRNKQFVICDEQLYKIFKTKKFKAFGMMKVLKNHIMDPRHLVDQGE